MLLKTQIQTPWRQRSLSCFTDLIGWNSTRHKNLSREKTKLFWGGQSELLENTSEKLWEYYKTEGKEHSPTPPPQTGEKKINLGLGIRAFTWHWTDPWFSLHHLKSASTQKTILNKMGSTYYFQNAQNKNTHSNHSKQPCNRVGSPWEWLGDPSLKKPTSVFSLCWFLYFFIVSVHRCGSQAAMCKSEFSLSTPDFLRLNPGLALRLGSALSCRVSSLNPKR